jgi:hypothetical protein
MFFSELTGAGIRSDFRPEPEAGGQSRRRRCNGATKKKAGLVRPVSYASSWMRLHHSPARLALKLPTAGLGPPFSVNPVAREVLPQAKLIKHPRSEKQTMKHLQPACQVHSSSRRPRKLDKFMIRRWLLSCASRWAVPLQPEYDPPWAKSCTNCTAISAIEIRDHVKRHRGSGMAFPYISLRPSIAFSIVISSVYSMSLPTGMPMAMRVTFTPARLSCCER